MDAKTFAKVRELVGTQAEMQAGVGDAAWTGQAEPEVVRVGFADEHLFPTLGVRPLLGRAIESLADSIRSGGLIHTPKGRPHPERAGWIELMPGDHMMVMTPMLQQRIAKEMAEQRLPEGGGEPHHHRQAADLG